eukprot:NODE_3336_length_909_cov_207.566496_g3314_i0.p1 GENE.NODE_3336_length_909_cov_207.566496_g3314_i0~~NODE_3336_length_909_cov_207.566496_g3314_i0.p1  ORF type:complete len:183 (-),score=12.40 NODE_3336_length_909_cov_207.566496_g3314_i0:272-820(-)
MESPPLNPTAAPFSPASLTCLSDLDPKARPFVPSPQVSPALNPAAVPFKPSPALSATAEPFVPSVLSLGTTAAEAPRITYSFAEMLAANTGKFEAPTNIPTCIRAPINQSLYRFVNPSVVEKDCSSSSQDEGTPGPTPTSSAASSRQNSRKGGRPKKVFRMLDDPVKGTLHVPPHLQAEVAC